MDHSQFYSGNNYQLLFEINLFKLNKKYKQFSLPLLYSAFILRLSFWYKI